MAAALADALLRGERVALARAISLVESRAPRHRPSIDALLSAALPRRAATVTRPVLRVGISGPPGAGKSTLIEALGSELLSRGHRLAVLAVDPSSLRTGGSVLGDKTRMPTLSADRRAFVRPSPTRGALGGVARRTQDALLLCECAGYDRTIVETVGVGQSEVAVSGMVDMFVLLVPPGAGDELQGIKRGIMELVDLAIVTKADGTLRQPASEAAQHLRSALKVLRPRSVHWTPPVMEVSAMAKGGLGSLSEIAELVPAAQEGGDAEGGKPARAARRQRRLQPAQTVADVADTIERFHTAMGEAGALERRREAQAVQAVREHALQTLLERIGEEPEVEALVAQLAGEAARGVMAPSQAGALRYLRSRLRILRYLSRTP